MPRNPTSSKSQRNSMASGIINQWLNALEEFERPNGSYRAFLQATMKAAWKFDKNGVFASVIQEIVDESKGGKSKKLSPQDIEIISRLNSTAADCTGLRIMRAMRLSFSEAGQLGVRDNREVQGRLTDRYLLESDDEGNSASTGKITLQLISAVIDVVERISGVDSQLTRNELMLRLDSAATRRYDEVKPA